MSRSLFSMTVLSRPIKMRQWWYSCLFDVYMDCCSLSVTGPQTSTSQAILIKRYSKHYRHNVKSPYECFMDQNGVHGYWNSKVLYCHWPSTSNIKTLVCSNSTGTILEKDAYFPSLMDRHTSRLIFCKMIRYTLYYHLSPVVEFSHGAFFC